VGVVVPRSLGEGEDEYITPCHLNPNSNEGDTNDQTPNDTTAEETYEEMMTYELREQVSELAIRLWNEGVIVLPPIIWDGESGEKEKLAMERAGFLFSMYQVNYWWFEIFELTRKLIMNGVLVYIHHDQIRTAIGFAICFLSLLISFSVRPFASPKLNSLMITGLSIQTITLAYGILVSIQNTALKDTSASRFELLMLEWVVVLLNCLCIIFPYILELMDLGLAGFKTIIHSWRVNKQVKYAYVIPEQENARSNAWTNPQMGLVQASGDREDGTHFTLVSDMGFDNGRGYTELQLIAT
jgi:hypothetical protein